MKHFIALIGVAALLTACGEKKTEFIHLENESMSVFINPVGAEIKNVISKKTNHDIMWNGSEGDIWKGTSPIMFPVAVRFTNNEYTYKGNRYEMPTLGVVKASELELVKSTSQSATFVLEANEDTKKNYPFDFRLSVTYSLDGNELINEFNVENFGDEAMPYAMGGHPGFALPLKGGKTRDDFEITLSSKVTTDRPILIEGSIGPERKPFLENEDVIGLTDMRVPDHGMVLLGHGVERIGVAEKGEKPFVEIRFDDFPNVNIWSPPSVPFVAIEPMIGHHDFAPSNIAIEDKDYLLQLGAGQSASASYSILVH